MLFDQLSSYQVLLDLLYDSKKFGDLLRIYKVIQKRIITEKSCGSYVINAIIFATYFRLVGANVSLSWSANFRLFSLNAFTSFGDIDSNKNCENLLNRRIHLLMMN